MEDHKSEIENWDLGAGIYVSFYSIRSSLPDANNIMSELGKKLVLDSDCFLDSFCGYDLRKNKFKRNIFNCGQLDLKMSLVKTMVKIYVQ